MNPAKMKKIYNKLKLLDKHAAKGQHYIRTQKYKPAQIQLASALKILRLRDIAEVMGDPDHKHTLSRLTEHYAIALQRDARINASIVNFIKSICILERFCSSLDRFPYDLSRMYINLGLSFHMDRDYENSIPCHQKAIRTIDVCKNISDDDKCYIQLVAINNISVSYYDYNNIDKSSEKNLEAISIAKNYPHKNADISREYARAVNIAYMLSEKTGFSPKDDVFEDAIKEVISYERQHDQSSIAIYKAGYANLLKQKGKTEAALSEYADSINLYETTRDISIGSTSALCALYSSASDLLSFMETPLKWAVDKSIRFVDLLELTPDNGLTGWDDTNLQSMRDCFAWFHANWLSYAIKEQAYKEIPRILFAIQGRELAAEVLDQLIDVDDSNLPEQIKKFAKIRRQLREMSERNQKSSPGGGDLSPISPDTRSLSSWNTQQSEKAGKKASKEYNRLHRKMVELRNEVAKLPDFEALQLPYDSFTLEFIQRGMADSHGILLLISFEGINGILLISKTGKPRWFAIDTIDKLAERTNSLAHSNPRGLQGYRRNTSDDKQSADQEQTISPEERLHFWPNMIRDLKETIWNPLMDCLPSNINELIILPQGSLHQLPIECGKPEGLSLRFYPGLVFYGLETGLIKKNPSEPIDDTICSVGLLHYDHRGNHEKYLPGVAKEIKAIRELYGDGHCQDLGIPDPYPNQPGEIKLLHFSGHGGKDPHNEHSTAIEVGKNQTLGQRNLLLGKGLVKHAFINSCTTGRIREDSRGTPVSLVTGLMRSGTRSITAALQPISDQAAARFGILWHKHWLESDDKDPCRTLEKTKEVFHQSFLKEKWNADLTDHVTGNHKIRDEFRDYLVASFNLNQDEAAEIDRLIKQQENDPKGWETLPELLIQALEKMGRFNQPLEQYCHPDLGTMLFCMRVYGA